MSILITLTALAIGLVGLAVALTDNRVSRWSQRCYESDEFSAFVGWFLVGVALPMTIPASLAFVVCAFAGLV